LEKTLTVQNKGGEYYSKIIKKENKYEHQSQPKIETQFQYQPSTQQQEPIPTCRQQPSEEAKFLSPFPNSYPYHNEPVTKLISKTPGGVFFSIVKKECYLNKEETKKIFNINNNERRKLDRKNYKIMKELEKLQL
jgi:hypothetical protein